MDERKRIREAVYELTLERGWTRVTKAAVLERADLEDAAFKRHYADLEECLLEVYEEISAALMARVSSAVTAEDAWLEQMRALGRVAFEFLLEDEHRARLFVVEVVSAGDRVRVARERDLDAICRLIDRGRLELDDPQSVGFDTARALAGTTFLRVYQAVVGGTVESAYEIVPELMHMLVLPYLGEQAAIAELRRPAPDPPSSHGVSAPG